VITSFNFYYAHPSREQAVLRQRLHASDVRQKIGLARGRVLARAEGAATLPDVIWELQFEDVAGHHADMAVRAASAEFEAVRAGMRALCRRFERPLFEARDAAAGSSTRPTPREVVALDWIFCPSEKVSEAAAIVEAEVGRLAQAGLDRSAILRLIPPGNDLPDLIWQHEHVDVASYDSMQARIERRAGVEDRSSTLASVAHRVERSVWTVRGSR